LPKFWNPEKQRAKETKQFLEYPEFNSVLDTIETAVKTVYRRLTNDGVVPSVERIKLDLIKELKRDQRKEKLTFLKFIEELIQNTAKKPVTVKNYKHSLVKLKEYQKNTKKPVDFENINLEFYNDYVNYLNERGFAANTIGGQIKNIKVFMNEATDRGLTTNRDYLNKRFKVLQEHADAIYLTQEEIQKLFDLDLIDNQKLEKVRDLFVVGCYTGLRIADLKKINRDNFIQNNTQIKIKTQKTGETVVIPLHKLIRHIFDKYEGVLPNAPTQTNKMNEYLKEIA
jgi:site-specific recombinase XerD